jgi:hypothetical protein
MSLFRKFLSKMHDKYRLVIINDSSLGESFSFRLSPLNVLMLLAMLTMLIFLLVLLLSRFTPVTSFTESKIGNSGDYMELNQKIEDLKQEIKARDLKDQAITKIINGEEMSLDSTQAHLRMTKEVEPTPNKKKK